MSEIGDVLVRDLTEQGGHFDGCHGCFRPFVAHFATGSFYRLLNGFGRDETKDAGNSGLDADLGDP
jgi:hypothetical protein